MSKKTKKKQNAKSTNTAKSNTSRSNTTKSNAEKPNSGSGKTGSGKKKKYKFTVMDYITIGFTIVIVIIMIIFLLKALKPEWFEKKDKGGTPTATQQNVDPQATDYTPTTQPTEEPYYSGIGNAYGNMSNDAAAAEIDGRQYRVNKDSSGTYSIIVNDGETDRVLLSGETKLSSISVIKDPFTYADVAGSTAYLVTFIDGSGNICAVTDGPLPSSSDSAVSKDDATATAKKVVTEGLFSSCVSIGENMYAIDGDGYIVKIALTDGAKTTLSKEKYTALCVYFGSIYALSQDGDVFVLTTSPRPAESSEEGEDSSSGTDGETVPGVDKYEMMIAEGQYRALAVFDDWVYAAGESGVSRYDADYYGRDTLTGDLKPVAVNVDRRGIFLLVVEDGDNGSDKVLALYAASAKRLLSGKAELVEKFTVSSDAAAAESYRITLCSECILVTSAYGGEVFRVELGDAAE